MRKLILLLVTLTLLSGAVWLTRYDPGYVVLGRGLWSLETSLPVFIGLLLLVFGIFYFFTRFISQLYHLPEWWQQRGLVKRQSRARNALYQGVAALAETRWQEAENIFIKGAPETLHRLGAAYAAHQRGISQAREQYFQQALQQAPSELTLGIYLFQTHLALKSRHIDSAEHAVLQAYKLQSKHPYVLYLLAQVLLAQQDWPKLAQWLPELIKRKACDDETLNQLEQQTYQGIMEQAIAKGAEPATLAWKNLPKNARLRPVVTGLYARYLNQIGQGKLAASLIRDTLQQQWDSTLARLYSDSEGDTDQMLTQAENWLKKFPTDSGLLHSLGVLSVRARMMGKAQEYFQQSLNIQPSAATYLALGDLLEQIGDTKQAARQYRLGLASQ